MRDIDIVRRLIEILSAFFCEGIPVEEDLTYSLTSEFLRNLQDVLFTKQIVSFSRFQEYFNDKSKEMLSSPENYLRHVFYACIQDGLVNSNIFERFLDAFAIILRISIETRLRSCLDYCKFIPNIFMELYVKKLNQPFFHCQGFRRLVEYINNPKYLESKCIVRNISSFYNPNAFLNDTQMYLSEKARRMIRKEQKLKTCFKFEDDSIDTDIFYLVKFALKVPKPEFVPNPNDLNASPSGSVQQKIAQTDEEKKILEKSEGHSGSISERNPSLNSDSKTNDDAVVQMTDNERYEDIIKAVIKHNRSKNSCHLKSKGRIQTEADQNLQHMKSTIQSLILVLDEYDKE